jgi:hypothetical protein
MRSVITKLSPYPFRRGFNQLEQKLYASPSRSGDQDPGNAATRPVASDSYRRALKFCSIHAPTCRVMRGNLARTKGSKSSCCSTFKNPRYGPYVETRQVLRNSLSHPLIVPGKKALSTSKQRPPSTRTKVACRVT